MFFLTPRDPAAFVPACRLPQQPATPWTSRLRSCLPATPWTSRLPPGPAGFVPACRLPPGPAGFVPTCRLPPGPAGYLPGTSVTVIFPLHRSAKGCVSEFLLKWRGSVRGSWSGLELQSCTSWHAWFLLLTGLNRKVPVCLCQVYIKFWFIPVLRIRISIDLVLLDSD
jgi:hypothetical protein